MLIADVFYIRQYRACALIMTVRMARIWLPYRSVAIHRDLEEEGRKHMAVRALVAKQLSTAAANGSGSGSVKQGTSAPSTGGIVIKEGGSGSSSGSGKAEGEGMEIDDEEYARLLAAEQDEMERKRGGKGGKGKAGEHFKECVG